MSAGKTYMIAAHFREAGGFAGLRADRIDHHKYFAAAFRWTRQ